ncbi:MAG: LacI family transcriptional regulator [Spirochaetales bacterium]|nr:LacI family transcriptional regulator [Spirochaetales bacterium]
MSIKEIAELAGVSKATVSLALNGRKGVAHDTRMKVLKIAEGMGYRVPSKRIVVNKSLGFIMFARLCKHGLILNEDQNSFIMEYINGMNRIVTKEGYTFEIFDYRVNDIADFIGEVTFRKPKGVIILGTELDEEDVKELNNLPIPHLLIDTYYEQVSKDYVNMANIGALYEVVSHFYQTGHSTVGMVTSRVKSGNVLMRERGFNLAVEQLNLKLQTPPIEVAPGFDGAYQDMKAYLKGDGSLPQGLFCYNDLAAFGVVKALKEHGLKIPDDLSIIGFDNLPMSAMMEPMLTTVRIPNQTIGELAANSIIERINNRNRESHSPLGLLVSGSLIIRESVRDLRK